MRGGNGCDSHSKYSFLGRRTYHEVVGQGTRLIVILTTCFAVGGWFFGFFLGGGGGGEMRKWLELGTNVAHQHTSGVGCGGAFG